MSKKIRNMEEFATVAGISRPTVSKYFNDPDSVRPTTRARIEKALGKYDYRPNIFAVNQNRKLTKTVGIVVPTIADPYFAEMARILEERCLEAGFSPSVQSAHGSRTLETTILDNLRAMKPAGVLFAPLGRRSSDITAIEAFCRDVPTILFDSNIEGMGEAFVGSDNRSFVDQTVDYLRRTGSAPCLFEMAHPANPNAIRRREAYVDAMTRSGLVPQIHAIEGTGWAFEEIGRQGALKFLDADPLTSRSVLCSNDRLAIGFLSACYERGVSVGFGPSHDLRMASMDDHPFARFTCPPLTTCAHDYDAVARITVETLLQLIERGGRFETRTERLIPSRLVLRESA